MRPRHLAIVLCLFTLAAVTTEPATAQSDRESAPEADSQRQVRRLLLLGQGPDGHPPTTHEYNAGMRIIAKCLHDTPGLQMILVQADEPWKEGPELIDGADGVVLFLSEGAKWVHQDPARLAALKELAARGGGIAVLHWGMGTRDAGNIDEFLKLAGGCHGGPDRKHKVVDTRTQLAAPGHPILRGVEPIAVREEFYYQLKFVKPADGLTPLLKAEIDGEPHTVSWAWERPDGGRSFGFTGLHFHQHWELPEYRKLVAQGVLWTMKLPIPEHGVEAKIAKDDLRLPPVE
jgi:type 1 glutamine amidotransferase